jgi:DNA-binding FadR family transcriptional regulator
MEGSYMQIKNNPNLIRAPKLSDQVARFLMGEIRSGRVKPGDKLPAESKLAATIGVSRTIIREALVRLEYDGLLESRGGSRTRIADPIKKTAFRIEDPRAMDKDAIKQIYELRAILEVAAAALAAKKQVPEKLQEMETCIEELNRAVITKNDAFNANLEFHKLIAQVADNIFLAELMDFLNDKILAVIQSERNLAGQKGLPQSVQAEHVAIFKAIKKGDADSARRLTLKHLTNAAARQGIVIETV